MYSFLDRLINLALPRIRDFQGINAKSFDGHPRKGGGASVSFRLHRPFMSTDHVNRSTTFYSSVPLYLISPYSQD